MNQNRGKVTITVGFFVSVLIEVLQLVTRRGLFEFDDIVHNTLGVVVGYFLYVFFSEKWKQYLGKRRQNGV